MNRQISAMLVFSLIAFLTGCAFTTDRIELQYPQQLGAKPLTGANTVSVATKVNDLRNDKSKVGSKKNGFGMETAPIITVEDVSVTFQKAIEQALRVRGFNVDPNTARVQIVADLTRFYNDHKPGFFAGDAVADLNMLVTVKSSKGDHLYTRQIIAEGREDNIQLATGNNAMLALNRALENGIRILFEDKAFIDSLLATP